MIRELVEYAEKHRLVTRPGYQAKAVQWAVDITGDGFYLGVTPLGDPSRRRDRGVVFPLAPHLEQPELASGGQPRCHFLIETAAVVLNMADSAGKAAGKHAFFRRMLKEAAGKVPELALWDRCLADPQNLQRIQSDLRAQGGKPTDRVTIRCGGQFLVERDDWHAWWDAFRLTLRGPESHDATGRCLVTGQWGPIALTHPKISGLVSVGGSSMGSALVSFDKAAFTSYGLDQAANAPMLESVAVAYQSALNELIRQGLTLSNLRVAYWYREPIDPADDPMAWLGPAADDDRELQGLAEVRAALNQLFRSKSNEVEAAKPAHNRVYMLLLSGVAGRVMIRGWHEQSYEVLKAHVAQWFWDLEVIRPDGRPPRPRSFSTLLRQLTVRTSDEVPAPQVRQLWEAAVQRRAIPLAIARRAFDATWTALMNGETPQDGVIGILRAYLIRKQGGSTPMESALNPNRPEVSYQLGRLLAVIDALQAVSAQSARGQVAGRYFRAFSVNPLAMFSRLLQLAQYYLSGIEADGLQKWFRSQLTTVIAHVTDVPATMSFEEQALFALGFYHQVAAMSHPRSEEEASV
ncbi:MAG: type I-C CRISPR-associated protein Cas8c/Csd1 [Acidithiobacillus sp.]|nr:type I-C CRISPR-associated protein Cas8c/Csd1 [Acidithiobacillus sp.]